jgi:superfamily II DNA or RNA helicase
MIDVIDYFHECLREKVALYTNRKLLTRQLSGVLRKAGVEHGVRAAGYESQPDRPIQICSFQTENARVLKKVMGRGLHRASCAIIDEAHLNKETVARKVMDWHLKNDGIVIGYTATPLDLGDVYDVMVQAGVNSELRTCGSLVAAEHYGPDEPDFRQHRVGEEDEISEQLAVSLMGNREALFGRVFEWYDRLNPDRLPTILFAASVAESLWFAQQFKRMGIPAAHIDGTGCWFDGEELPDGKRGELNDGTRTGRVGVLCNRFVLREGIDAPWLQHGIFATVFGSLQSYLQSGGRLLRACKGKAKAVIQDHGGNWWRHGSLNADRRWVIGDTAASLRGIRAERLREKRVTGEAEPARCPACAMILFGRICRGCGFELGLKRARPVVMRDGNLSLLWGDIFMPRKKSKRPDAAGYWKRCYYRCLKLGRTFRQAEAMYAMDNGWEWPPRTLPLMPLSEVDWFRRVRDVPMERLRKHAEAEI